uniref:Multiple PDZ domain crumbs cell polarity complex component n=1 Tax=Pavo cristatus TaxID=9049 RepID=A0A8C9FDI9_PAVCR
MLEAIDTHRALQAVERLQAKLRDRGDIANEEKLNLLKSVLQSPLFNQILNLQTSVQQLRDQVNITPPVHSTGEFPQLLHHGVSVGSLPHNESYLLAQQNGSPANVLEASMRSITPQINGKSSTDDFEQLIRNMSQGRPVETIELIKPLSGGLGFSVVGLKSENRGELGIFVQEIQEGSVAHRDGKLKEADQILAINGQALDQTITHQQAISILQKAKDNVQLVVARGNFPQLISPVVSRSPSAASTVSAHSNPVHWQHVETIELVNDGSGLGFGIVGGKSTGVIVKTILPGGVADQHGRLCSGDHILKIGDTDLTGMSSEQVAQVLRQCGNRVKLVIARGPVEEPPPPAVPPGTPVPIMTPEKQMLSTNSIALLWTFYIFLLISYLILQVDGTNLQGFTNQQAVDVLRHTGQTVRLTLIRRGHKQENYNQPQEDFSAAVERDLMLQTMDSSTAKDNSETEEGSPSQPCSGSAVNVREDIKQQETDFQLSATEEAAMKAKWQRIMGSNYEIVVSKLTTQLFTCTPPPPSQWDAHIDLGFIGSSNTEETALEISTAQSIEEVQNSSFTMWEAEVQNAELEKGSMGLGFSILDYQDPVDPSKTVILIRSLVPGGVAERDGRLSPGDRLMFVNDISLENGSLEEAVQALKGAPAGIVKIGVAKPLPLSPEEGCVSAKEDCFFYTAQSLEEEGPADAALFHAELALVDSSGAGLAVEPIFEPHFATENLVFPTSSPVTSDSFCSDDFNFGFPFSTSTPKLFILLSLFNLWIYFCNPDSSESFLLELMVFESSDKEMLMESSLLLTMDKIFGASNRVKNIFEETITIAKGNSSLGMTVSSDKDGAGMIVRSVIHGGSISRDGRINVGDCILSINEESSTNLTNAQARAMLRRHSLIGPEINITYVVAENLPKYRASLEQQSEETMSVISSSQSASLHLFCSLFYHNRVELWREPGKSLGISIVGGRGMGSRLSSGEVMRGIFIKHILEDSPAGKNGTLKTGDRIVEVDGIDLTDASHEQAVEAIRKAGNPVVFVVQSIISRPRAFSQSSSEPEKTSFCNLPLPPPSAFSGISCDVAQSSSSQVTEDVEKEDEFGYSWKRITQRYGSLPGELHMIELEKGRTGLGLSLAGNKDRSRMSVFIVGIDPNGAAGKDGRLQIADELLEVNLQDHPVQLMAVCPAKSIEALPCSSETLQNQEVDSTAESGVSPDFGSYKNIQHVELPKWEVQLHSSPSFLYIIQFINLLKSSKNTVKLTINSAEADSQTVAPILSSAAPAERRNIQPPTAVSNSPEPEAVKNTSRSSTPATLASDPATCPIIPGCETTIDISKGQTGLGLSIVGGSDTLLGAIIIHEVYEEGAASKDGRLWAGDQILEVNGIDLRSATHDEAINVLRQTPQKVRLTVYRDEAQYKEEDMYDVLIIELQKKPGKGLGLSIVGKRYGYTRRVDVWNLLVMLVFLWCALLRCSLGTVRLEVGRIKAGPFQSERRTSQSSQVSEGSGSLSSFGIPASASSTPEVFESSLKKNTGKISLVHPLGPADSLGVSIAGGVGSPLGDIPIFIAMMHPNGVAGQTQKLRVGDRIVSICGTSTEGMTHSQAVNILKNASGTIELQVVAGGDVSVITGQQQDPPTSSLSLAGLTSTSIFQDDLGSQITDELREKNKWMSLQLCVVLFQGAAAEDGRLKRGDQIIAVNGQSLEGVTHEEAVAILKRTKGTVTLTVLS